MVTNLAIDPDLLDPAMQLSSERTNEALVTKALQEFIAHRQQAHVLDLVGRSDRDASSDYKAVRERDSPSSLGK